MHKPAKQTQLDILEKWLRENNYNFERIDEVEIRDVMGRILSADRHQIVVSTTTGRRLWDAICQRGSMGYRDGLLEIMGTIVDLEKAHGKVEGWLKASDVIARLGGGVV